MKYLRYILSFFLLATVCFAQQQRPVAPDEPYQKLQFNFTGAWLPDQDPAEIGPSNFQTLQNMRYSDLHPEGVQGYSKINTTALTTYTKIRSGIQLRSDRTKTSYVLVQAENAGETASQVFQNQTAIPDQGDFEGTALHTDASGAGLGRFATVANGEAAYTNGVESMIWSGEEHRVSGLFTLDDASYTNPIDWTEQANNTLTDTANVFTVDDAGQEFWLIFTTRPAQGFNYTIKTANDTASTTTVKFWDGDSFDAVSNLSDGTSEDPGGGAITLYKSGEMSFDLPAVKPFHLEGLYLYAYLMEISGGQSTISYVTADIPWQSMTDVWDAVYRQPIQFQYQDDTTWEDYTLEVNKASTADYAYVADISGLTAADDEIIIMFEERMAGIRFEMLEGAVNANAANLTVKYWDGDSWATVGTSLRDETDTGPCLAQTGLISWSPESFSDERAVTKFGTKGYAYQITSNADLSATVKIDLVTGIPAQLTIKPFAFPSTFKNRTLLAGYTAGKEGNRVDYSMTNAPDVFNGLESSEDGLQSLYFGGSDPMTAGVEIFNRFGSNVFSMWIGFKAGETYILRGDGPEDFQIDLISPNIGCPAPLTLATAEVGYELAEGVYRNVAIWLSSSGPMIFDGGVISPIKGIDYFFDPKNAECVNFDAISVSRGWYDPVYHEYNLLLPSGSGQTSNNLWVVYDIARKKWFQKYTGSAEFPQEAFQVMDDYGTKYIYAGIDTGRLMRLEYGTTWDGTVIEQMLVTGDFWPTGSIWDKTIIRDVKLIARKIGESNVVDVVHLKDTEIPTGGFFIWSDTDSFLWADTTDFKWSDFGVKLFSLDISQGTKRLARATAKINSLAWSHAFSFELSTSNTEKGFQPIGFGIQYQYARDDL